MLSLLCPSPVKSDASLLHALHLSWVLSPAQGQMPSCMNKHSTPSILYEPDTTPSTKKRWLKVSRVPNTRSCSHENQRTLTSPLWESGQTSEKQDITWRSFGPVSLEVSACTTFSNSSLQDFLHLSLEAAGASHCQTGPRSSAALLQDLSCWRTGRAHTNKGFASKSAGLDTKLWQLYSWTEPVPT